MAGTALVNPDTPLPPRRKIEQPEKVAIIEETLDDEDTFIDTIGVHYVPMVSGNGAIISALY
jgi:hypothetical protein